MLAARPEGPLWLFAYGSLLWRPEFETIEARRAVAYGWQRGFSMQILSHRGTPEQPGYMMCLDQGGECEDLALRLREAVTEVRLRFENVAADKAESLRALKAEEALA